ncbi:MAG: T9SS type A sorting domain-containing protein [Saprospiraceae bacterium]|nr:T9SS type A sorting domain-containing protein [Saprospiraceae bacterium]
MKLHFILAFIFVANYLGAQDIWQIVDEQEIADKNIKERETEPSEYLTFKLNMDAMKRHLKKAGHEKENPSKKLNLSLPYPNGEAHSFEFIESPCFSPVLSAKYPQIKSFRGYNPKTGEQARIDYGTQGFHAVISSRGGTIYIDPYFRDANEYHVSYYVIHDVADTRDMEKSCGVSAYESAILEERNAVRTNSFKAADEPVIKTTYRLALSCTGAWGQLFGTLENVLSRMNTGVNRLNMIFENDIATKFELIDDNDLLINLTVADDPFEMPNVGSEILLQNTGFINSRVGSNAYDIGHVFTTRCTDVGGVAFPAAVCNDPIKGAGVSCIGTSNVPNFVARTTAHEIGHQFTGGHTWNNCPTALDQLSPGTAWEPGSGSTILSYGGNLCGSANNVGSRDQYFHVGSLQQFINYQAAIGCGEKEESDNHTPDINMDYEDGFFIPISTPFELDASATDIDGDILTYNWEQMNTGQVSTLGSPIGDAPSFRSFPPTTNTLRTFPQLSAILNGISEKTEVLPTYSRDFDFRFTVRDNHPGAGYTVWEDISFKSTASAGPFKINYPNQVLFKEVGDTLTIKWDVANTDKAPVNAELVDIYLSSDGGLNFDYLLKGRTPNDGEELIIIPNRVTQDARLKVKAHDNIFFDIGISELIISEPTEPGFFVEFERNSYQLCLPDALESKVVGTAFLGFDNEITLDIIDGLPEGAAANFSQNPMPSDGQSVLTFDLDNSVQSGIYDITLRAVSQDADTVYQIISLDVTSTNFDGFGLISPANGTDGLGGTPEFIWNGVTNATEYTLEVSKSPVFGASNVIFEEGLNIDSITPQIALENSTLYYWRVAASNKCSEKIYSPIQTFGTVALSCRSFESEDLPKNISATGNPTVTSVIEVFEAGQISDVNITNIKALHLRIRDLQVRLFSPLNTEALLFENRCFTANLNVGFDSDSPVSFGCNLNSGLVMKPEKTDLSIFNGEDIQGPWTLEIKDTDAGEGGQLQGFEIELCSNTSLNNPELINNIKLDVPTGMAGRVLRTNLLTEDSDNVPDELIYTLVELPEFGSILFNEGMMVVGDQFTQADIDDGLIKYVHEGTEDVEDGFVFTVIDGAGGWIDLTRFVINVNANVISSTEDILEDGSRFNIYPNPTSGLLNVHDEGNSFESWNLELLSFAGQLLQSSKMKNHTSLDISNLEAGSYIIRLSNANGSHYRKISLIR